MSQCHWCGEEGKLEEAVLVGETAEICENCSRAVAESVCRTCGNVVTEFESYKGQCMDCMQISLADRERKRMETIEGLSSDFSPGTELSEEAFEKWLTMETPNMRVTPEMRERSRVTWLKCMLRERGWQETEIVKNENNIRELLKSHALVILKKAVVIVHGKNVEELRGKKVIANSGDLYVIEKEKN